MNMSTTSEFQLRISPDGQEIFRNFDSNQSAKHRSNQSAKHHHNPRKKRTKLIRMDNSVASSSTKPKYVKKPDPGAPKITPPCSECGKKFWSWKALFGHMRCHPERQWRGINPPSNFRRLEISNVGDFEEPMTEEDYDAATCLLMLANEPVTSESATIITIENQVFFDSDTVVRDLVMGNGDMDRGINSRFECYSCKKVFGSRQALGGHRASHKNVKGCFAITRNEVVCEEDRIGEGEDKGMVMDLGHRCHICLRVFSSGQALGGHKRCHWEKGDETSLLTTQMESSWTKEGGLDLNLPPPTEDNSSSSYSSSGLTLDLRLGL